MPKSSSFNALSRATNTLVGLITPLHEEGGA